MSQNLFNGLPTGALSDSEKLLLEQIVSYLACTPLANIQQLADQIYTSPASVIRLCKKLGLEGYNELKYFLRQPKRKPTADNPAVELSGILEGHYQDLLKTAASVSEADLQFVTNCLCSRKNIYLFGRGMSYMPVMYMHQVLLSVDRDCICYIDPPLMFHAAVHMSANDVVFIASSGGATSEICKAARLAKEHQAAVIALTSDLTSPLSQIADVRFLCEAPRRYLNNIDIKSRFTMMFIIDAILECYLNRLNLKPSSDPRLYLEQQNW